MIGLPYGEKKLCRYVKPFSSDTGTLRTDRQTDRFAISISRVSMLTRDNKNYTYSLQGTQLERLEHMKDLGVIFDSELNFLQHCKEKINTAYSYLGIIKRNFIYFEEDSFVVLYKSLVRSNLEYANSVWNPHRLGLIKDLEKVQMRATKLVITIKNLINKDRLKRLKLPTLKYTYIYLTI